MTIAENFYTSLRTFDRRVALVTQKESLTYEALAMAAANNAEMIGHSRRLVFLEADNTAGAIAMYLGCLVGGHVVYLFAPQDRPKALNLAEKYLPNRLYLSNDGTPTLASSHDRHIDLHPALRLLLATSGSTGSPKFVKLSEQNISSNAKAIAEYLELNDSERAITSLKFNYSYGMSVVNSHLASGGALILTNHSVVDGEFWDTYEEQRVTSFAGVPYTFEILAKGQHKFYLSRHLRYVTQAGGRLSSELVRHFARLGASHGWRFYVMYGQTEASPRISYLPPSLALECPNSIGVAIPGGRLGLLEADGSEIGEFDKQGELVYSGPNVMMGYAQSAEDLSTGDSIGHLLTGDIAKKNSAGLYFITGRSSRFVKPFGVRLNLDDIESRVKSWAPSAVCAGSNETVIVAILRSEVPADADKQIQALSTYYSLPSFGFELSVFDEMPRLSSGKPDYQSIVMRAQKRGSVAQAADGGGRSLVRNVLSTLTSQEFLHEITKELKKLFGMSKTSWTGVTEIFETFLSAANISDDNSFTDLAGDSLSYVQTSLALEEYLGSLPPNWERMSVNELERHRQTSESI